jgi:putative ABC transport system permease protein
MVRLRQVRAFLHRLAGVFRKRDDDLAAEIDSHLELHIEDNLRAGMTPEAARREANLKFGGIESAKERYRDRRGIPLLDHLAQDLRYGLRQLRRRPAFTATAVAALALGIGVTTAIFSVVNTVLLRPLPVADPDRLVMLTTLGSSDGDAASPSKFVHWQTESSVLQDVSAIFSSPMNYTSGKTTEQWRSSRVSASAFRCWGVPILKGRGFTREEDLPSGPSVALISEEIWKHRFASDPLILGKTISLNGEPRTIVGIAGNVAAQHEFGPRSDVYVPFQIDPHTTNLGNYFDVLARLKPGVGLEEARSRLQASTAEYRAKFPGALGPKERFTVKPLRDAIVGDARPLLVLLLGAVSFVLLIACANVTNLLLVRAAGRRREIAIRAAIGAGRGRVIRQLLTESVLLSAAGGALGLLLGHAGIRALLAVNTAGLPLVGPNGTEVTMDWRVMTFAIVVSLVTGIVFGLFPAFQGSRTDVSSILKNNDGRSSTGLRLRKAHAALVISEVGLAVILLVGSALLIRSFAALYAVQPGFETKNVVTMDVLMAGPKNSKASRVADTVRRGLERIRSTPGVAAAGTTCCLPLAQGTFNENFEIVGDGRASSPAEDIGWTTISSGYFDAYKIAMKRGRQFTDRDDSKSPAVVIINERMAQTYWKDADPLKDRILIGQDAGVNEFKDEPVRQIIGIVSDVREEGLDSKPRAVMYVPQAQLTDAESALFFRLLPMGWVIRTQAESQPLVKTIQEELENATGLPVTGVASMDQVVWAQTGRERFNLLLMTIFGCSALLLAAIGIYGLMAHTVAQQTQEIGIRLALGAEASGITRAVVRQGMSLALAGVLIGLAAAWGLARWMESLLFGVKTHDPMVYLTVPAILSLVALIAVWPAAARASRVSPAESLRYE